MPRVKFNKEVLHLNFTSFLWASPRSVCQSILTTLTSETVVIGPPKKVGVRFSIPPGAIPPPRDKSGGDERGRKRGHTFIRLSLCDHRAPQQNHQTMAPVCLRMCVSSQIRRPALCLNVSPHLLSLLIPPCCCSFFPPPLFSLSVELRGLIGDERESR